MLRVKAMAFLVFLPSLLKTTKTTKYEPFVIGGEYANIKSFPHSAFLAISCQRGHKVERSGCGSSILNQGMLITAGHCLEGCLPSSYVSVSVGSEHKKEGARNTARNFMVHLGFDEETLANDITLISLTKPLKFNPKVQRVAVYRNPMYSGMAEIAGWGHIDEIKPTGTLYLKAAKQKVWPTDKCVQLLSEMNKGTICAGQTGNLGGYSARGDSGSGLVAKGYILIGLVSYKMPSVSRDVVVYTDVSYFYDWIRSTARRLYCSGNNK